MMTKRVAGLMAAMAGAAAVGLAAPAWAGPLDGSYNVTVIDDSDGRVPAGTTVVELFSSCGQGCVNVHTDAPPDYQMHLQGTTWSGTVGDRKVTCQVAVDANTLVRTDVCNGTTLHYQLTKNG
jgi:hypothetical protein